MSSPLRLHKISIHSSGPEAVPIPAVYPGVLDCSVTLCCVWVKLSLRPGISYTLSFTFVTAWFWECLEVSAFWPPVWQLLRWVVIFTLSSQQSSLNSMSLPPSLFIFLFPWLPRTLGSLSKQYCGFCKVLWHHPKKNPHP